MLFRVDKAFNCSFMLLVDIFLLQFVDQFLNATLTLLVVQFLDKAKKNWLMQKNSLLDRLMHLVGLL